MTRWPDALLDEARRTGDPIADALAARYAGDADARRLLLSVVRADGLPPDLPAGLRAFFEDDAAGPDHPAGERFFELHGVGIMMLLGYSALPWTYALTPGNEVLIRTHRLTGDARRRVLETAGFVFDVAREGGLAPGGRGRATVKKVRLMHAAVRHWLHQDGSWDLPGVPICQEDLAATWCAFTVQILDGLHTMGVPVSAADEQAWIDLWQEAGHLLGLDPRLIPPDAASARALRDRIARRHHRASPAGAELARALVDFLGGLLPGASLMVPTQMRSFVGDAVGDMLSLPPRNATGKLVAGIDKLDTLFHKVVDVDTPRLAEVLGRAFVGAMLDVERGGDRPRFAMPDRLVEAWGITARDTPVAPIQVRTPIPRPGFAPFRPEPGVDEAITEGVAALFARQRPDGAFDDWNDAGAAWVGAWITVRRWLGLPFDEAAARAALSGAQLPGGAYTGWPGGERECAEATALALAGWRVLGGNHAAEAAWAQLGGVAGTSNVARFFLMLSGGLGAEEAGAPPLAFVMVPRIDEVFRDHWMPAMLPMLFGAAGAGYAVDHGKGEPGGLMGVAARTCVSRLSAMQDPCGTWAGVLPGTAFGVCALVGLGVPLDDPRVKRALTALDGMMRIRDGRMEVQPYTSAVWATAYALQALLAAGVDPEDARVVRAVDWLLRQQVVAPVDGAFAHPRPGAPDFGGWPFEPGGVHGMDADTTALVIGALARLPPSPRVRASIDLGLGWLLPMQNADGGWPAFAWGQPSKPPGAIMLKPAPILSGLVDAARVLWNPPIDLADPSTETLTGRVLATLAELGVDAGETQVAHAVDFLAVQAAPSGAWWGRWDSNYVLSTGNVLRGLAMVGQSPATSWMQAAIRFLEHVQLPDGGWGEHPDSYRDPGLAGQARHGTPTQTAQVVRGLVACGRGDSEVVRRGVRWLVDHRAHGTWADPYAVAALEPPTDMYIEAMAAPTSAVIALAEYRAAAAGRTPWPRTRPPAALAAWPPADRDAPMAGGWILGQRWETTIWAHWRVDAARLRPLVPEPLEIEEADGSAWISLVGVHISEARGAVVTPPGVGAMDELNVRTYVRWGTQTGVYFLTLWVDSRLMDLVAGTGFGLPMEYADIAVRGGSPCGVDLRKGGEGYHLEGRPTGPLRAVEPGSLDDFLVVRKWMLDVKDGQVVSNVVAHRAWSMAPVEGRVSQASPLPASLGLPLQPARIAIGGPVWNYGSGPMVQARPRR